MEKYSTEVMRELRSAQVNAYNEGYKQALRDFAVIQDGEYKLSTGQLLSDVLKTMDEAKAERLKQHLQEEGVAT